MCTRIILGSMLQGAFTIKHYGTEHIPHDGPLIIAANHIKWLDPFVIGLGIERLHFGMGKEECYFSPISRHILSWLGAFPVARKEKHQALLQKYPKKVIDRYLCSGSHFNYDEYFRGNEEVADDIRKTLGYGGVITGITIAQYLLMKNEAIIIHPEGTRHNDGNIHGCKTGIARIAFGLQEAYNIKTSVIPCAVAYAPFGFRSAIAVQFSEPLPLTKDVGSFTRNLENRLIELYSEAKLRIQ